MRNPVNLRSSLSLAWLPLVGLIPMVLTMVIPLFYFRSGDDPAAWQAPALAMVIMGAEIVLITGIGVALLVGFEYAAIRRVLASPWARWKPYPTQEQWLAVVEKDHVRALGHARISFTTPILLGVMLVFMLFMLNVVILPQNGAGVAPGIGLRFSVVMIALAVIAAAAIIGGGMVSRLLIEHVYRKQRGMALPEVVVGRGGAYHEAEGFTSFWGLRGCDYHAGGSGDAHITFSTFHYGFGRHEQSSWNENPSIPVPAENREEVSKLAERIREQILRKG